mgnify:FL=1|jgi:hypothetical protein
MLDFLLTEDMLKEDMLIDSQGGQACSCMCSCMCACTRHACAVLARASGGHDGSLCTLCTPCTPLHHPRASARLHVVNLAQISPLKHADFGLLSPGQSLTPHLGESPARKQGDAWPKE